MTKQEILKKRIDDLSDVQLERMAEFLDHGCTEKNSSELTANGLTEVHEQALLKDAQEAENGIGISPRFSTAKEANAWLRAQVKPV